MSKYISVVREHRISIVRDSRIYGAQTGPVYLKHTMVKRAAGVADVSKQIFMRVKLFCAFRSRHPHPWLYTPLPIDTHLYFYHHPTAPTAGIVYDTIRLIISCLYATIDRTANCTRHSDSKTVPPRALLQPFRSKTSDFFSERVSKPAKLVLLDSPLDSVTSFRDLSSIRTTVRTTSRKCSMDTSHIVHRCNHFVYDRNKISKTFWFKVWKNLRMNICCTIISKNREW